MYMYRHLEEPVGDGVVNVAKTEARSRSQLSVKNKENKAPPEKTDEAERASVVKPAQAALDPLNKPVTRSKACIPKRSESVLSSVRFVFMFCLILHLSKLSYLHFQDIDFDSIEIGSDTTEAWLGIFGGSSHDDDDLRRDETDDEDFRVEDVSDNSSSSSSHDVDEGLALTQPAVSEEEVNALHATLKRPKTQATASTKTKISPKTSKVSSKKSKASPGTSKTSNASPKTPNASPKTPRRSRNKTPSPSSSGSSTKRRRTSSTVSTTSTASTVSVTNPGTVFAVHVFEPDGERPSKLQGGKLRHSLCHAAHWKESTSKPDHYDGVWLKPIDPAKPHKELFMEELETKAKKKTSYVCTLPDDGKIMVLENVTVNLQTGECTGDVGEEDWAKAKVLWEKYCDSWDEYLVEHPELCK